jgi:hypothetical protein
VLTVVPVCVPAFTGRAGRGLRASAVLIVAKPKATSKTVRIVLYVVFFMAGEIYKKNLSGQQKFIFFFIFFFLRVFAMHLGFRISRKA